MVKQVPLCEILTTNAYFYIDEKTKHGFLVDPAAEPEKLLQIIKENGWTIEKILITHGHFDHIGAVEKLAKELNIPYYIHANGKQYLINPQMNLSSFFEQNISLSEAKYLQDGDEITLSSVPDVKLKVIYTPGHTSDSVVYYDSSNSIAFVGDTIFKDSEGRTDLPGGNYFQLYDSIRNKVMSLPDDTVLYSGHTEKTSVQHEKGRF
ncbi:MAG: MBL fold metallo-hydrolase [Alphaproteobacteria bacterium]|nr:MBL fold metallo-hydrolase [Alphaproteobacteria bacterium]